MLPDQSWIRVALDEPGLATPPAPPAYCGLVYAGQRHVFSGPPESAKTLLSWIVALEAIRDGATVAHVDFETLAAGTRRILDDLGATVDELARIVHIEPTRAPQPADLQMLQAHDVSLVIVDAAIGAFGITGLDDHKREDAEMFARIWIRPLFEADITTILIDHVTKNVDTRGRFPIGSERKLGSADVALGLEDVKAITRGGTGLIKVRVHKDRPGFLPRPYAAELNLTSDPDTHRITWTLAETTSGDGDHWMPTELMAKISRYLGEQTEPVTKAAVEREISGQAKWKRQAIDELITLGHVHADSGARGAILLSSVTPYPTPSDLVSTSSETGSLSPRLLVSPLRGDEDEDEVDNEVTSSELERLENLGRKIGLVG